MRAAQSIRRCRFLLRKRLAVFLYLLFAAQPLMDTLSFWLEQTERSNLPALAVRMAALLITVLAGLLLTRRRRVYWTLGILLLVFYILHALTCAYAGFSGTLFSDFTNYVRVAQIPLLTLCFITFCRTDRRAFRWMRRGFFISFSIITVIVLLSLITGTNPHTYQDTQSGVIGWFSTTNSQAAILSMSAPVLLCSAYRAKNPVIFAVTAVLSCGQLYLLGTRLAYMAIFATLFGLMIVCALCGRAERTRYLIMLAIAAACLAGYKVSPMYEHQMSYTQEMEQKQADASAMSSQRSAEISEEEEGKMTDLEIMRASDQIYAYYRTDLVQRFGLEYVIEKCDFQTDVSAITGARRSKIMFCSLLMDEEPFPSRLFGLERDKMEFKGTQYDVENDFHGIYFLYGIVGLVLFLAFVGYFIALIGKALWTDAAKYFTMDAGAFGIAFVLLLINAYNTAGILRRPNASFYMSVILAAVYYLVKLRRYPEGRKNAALPRLPLHILRKRKPEKI